MFDLTSFRIQFTPQPINETQFSQWFSFTANQQINLLGFDHNVIIKKIQITCSQIFWNDQVLSQWYSRLRLYNRDAQLIQGIRGNQINPTSGAFSDPSQLSANVQLIFSDKETIKTFDDGIYAAGFQFRSFSGLMLAGPLPIGDCWMEINFYTEKHAV